MKSKILTPTLLVALVIFPMLAMAANFDDEVNAELDRMYGQNKARSTSPSVLVNVNQGQQQDQNQLQAQAQKQPTTVIEASPLTESRADKIRKARQETEVQTEQKIVEKLEMSRIEDERRRSEVLFGDKFGQLAGQPHVQAPAPTPAPVPVVIAPVAVQEVAPPPPPRNDGLDREGVRSEISAALSELKKDEKPVEKMYFSALLGMGDYPDAQNLKGQYALGFAVGKTFATNMQVEGAFTYSSYQVEQTCSYLTGCSGGFYGGQYLPTITQMDQYQGALVAKYQVLGGMFRPVVGGALAYTYRSFTDTQFARYNSDATSQALDLGLVTGADLVVSDSFSVGLDFRYYFNVTSQTSSSFQKSFVNPQEPGKKPVEQLNYYTLGIVGRTSF